MKVLKKIFVSSGFVQCVCLLLIYLCIYHYKNDIVLLFSFFYSLFLSFFIIENKIERLLINNTAIIFIMFLFLYGIYNPTINWFLYDSIPDSIYFASVIYATTIPSFLIFWMIGKKRKSEELYTEQIKNTKLSGNYNRILSILLIIFILYKTYFFISVGMFFNFGGGNRLEFFENVGQLDVVIGLLISGIFLYFIYYFTLLPKKTRMFVMLLLFYYILLQLGAGNRRDFVPMILGIFWIFINMKKIKFSILGFVGILLFTQMFNYLATIREGTSKIDNVLMSTLTNNEFVYPFLTLSFEVEDAMNNHYEYRYGESYLVNPIVTFIPREIYPDKPISMANSFLKKFFGSKKMIGFAYTPVSEAFVNFGALGPMFIYAIFGGIISYIQNRKNQIVNFVFFAMILDFSRSEIGSFVYLFVIMSLFIWILPRVKKVLIF